jgi:predicted RNase H-like HicB family nuclease
VNEPRYAINVFWHEPDKCWIADIPDLRPCSALGDTPLDAVAEVEVAIALWLETARALGHEIPQPLYDPADYASR